jgi:hypothetical protein
MEFLNIVPEKLPRAYRYYFDRNFDRSELVEKIASEVSQNPAYHKFSEAFRGGDNSSFINRYAEKKAAVLLDSNPVRDKIEYHDQVIKKWAEEMFWDVQQKKLFDLQCLWRAEKIELPGIECTWDFYHWGRHLESCIIIPHVSQDEVDLYIEFLNSSNDDIENENIFCELQDYCEFKLNYNGDEDDGSPLPEWYEFHNSRTGNGVLLTLPDIRGEKEEYYRNIFWEENRDNKVIDERPLIIMDDENYEALMRKIETTEFLRLYRRLNDMNYIINSQEEVEEACHFLFNLYTDVPIEANADWRKGIISAKNRYVNKKIAEEMPTIYEEYQMKISLGISGATDEHLMKDKIFYESLRKPILEGRKLKGEPEDFNF